METINRRDFLTYATMGAAAVAAPVMSAGCRPASTAASSSAAGLREPAFRPLPLTSFKPGGWLLRQLRLQADGLTGHLDEFWPDVARSQWIGGDAEGWERAPYWLDGLVPLAWLLDDDRLKAKARRFVDEILGRQRADGWFSPFPENWDAPGVKPYDLWAIHLVDKVLAEYHAATGDDRALAAVERSLRVMNGHLDRQPLFEWGRFRWFEALVPAFRLYERTGEAWILDLARKLHDQGFDYGAFYRGEDVTVPTPRRGLWKWAKHVVNTGMAAKAGALWWRLSGAEADRRFPAEMIALLDRHHGQANGMFSGDECLAGKNPVQGTELCAVVEFLYSLEHLVAALGDPAFGDRLEKVAFNALPATFSPDMWAHQYDQQANQVRCAVNPDHMWTTNGPESNLYGLEPNYGCCTANMHQGWPKFAAHLWMRSPDGGLVAAAYAPGTVSFETADGPVEVALETDYPFREELLFRIKAPSGGARFPLRLRIPAWAEGASLEIAGGKAGAPPRPGTFHEVGRAWRDGDEVRLRLPMKVAFSRRYNGAIAVERGPLVYALAIGEKWVRVNEDKPHREPPHADWEVHPTTDWNYGLLVDEDRPETGLRFEERPVGERPFSPEGAGTAARVEGRKVPGWGLKHGWAAEIPPEPQAPDGPVEELTLLPYGCTNIRVTEFPRLKKAA